MKIGIAGAGIIGRLLALTLAEQGHTITLYDKTYADDRRTASHVAAGMLSPYAELEYGHPEITSLAADAVSRWEMIVSKLNIQSTLHAQGSLLVATSRDITELQHISKRLDKVNTTHQMISHDALCMLEPDLHNPSLHAVYLPEEGYLDTEDIMQGLTIALRQQNITWHENTLFDVNKPHDFDYLFDCRGMGAQKDLPNLRAIRGELIWLHAPHVSITRPIRLLHPRYPLYIVPRKNHHYIVGATQIESEDYSSISVQSTMELLSACYAIHPGFAEARIVHTATQCRPTFNNHLPQIIQNGNHIHINGMFRHGFLLAPKMVSDAIQLL